MSLFNASPGVRAVGRQTVATAGTAVQLSSTSSECRGVMIQAETDNTGTIVVGDSSVVAALATRKGVALVAGDREYFPIDNLTDLYIDTTVNTDGVTYIAYQ